MSTSKNKKNLPKINIDFFLKQLQIVKKKSGLKWGDFYNYAGFTRSAWSKWKNKERSPSAKQLNIIQKNLDCDIEWLIEGQGKPPACLRPKNTTIKNPVCIPIIGRVPAGPPDLIHETIIGYEYERDPRLKDCFCLKVKGDSMRPTLQPGDTVFFKLGGNIEDGDVIIVNDPFGETMIKRYRINEKGEEWLQSDNPEYAPIKNPGEFLEYRIVGKVIEAKRKLNLSMG